MEKYREFFHEYAAGFDSSDPAIWHKHEHTVRVVDNCRAIADSLRFSTHDCELAELIGLFHDFGRFEQWRTFHDFSDTKTINHADLGVRLLQERGILDGYPDQNLIFTAILNHNK